MPLVKKQISNQAIANIARVYLSEKANSVIWSDEFMDFQSGLEVSGMLTKEKFHEAMTKLETKSDWFGGAFASPAFHEDLKNWK